MRFVFLDSELPDPDPLEAREVLEDLSNQDEALDDADCREAAKELREWWRCAHRPRKGQ